MESMSVVILMMLKRKMFFVKKKLKKVEEHQSLLDLENRFVEGYNFDLKNIGDGQEKEVFDIKKKMFSKKRWQKSKQKSRTGF